MNWMKKHVNWSCFVIIPALYFISIYIATLVIEGIFKHLDPNLFPEPGPDNLISGPAVVSPYVSDVMPTQTITYVVLFVIFFILDILLLKKSSTSNKFLKGILSFLFLIIPLFPWILILLIGTLEM